MKTDKDIGNAFLDVVLVGVMLTTIGVVIDLLRGDGVELEVLGPALVLYVAYLIGALRTGVSPVEYLRGVARRGSLPG